MTNKEYYLNDTDTNKIYQLANEIYKFTNDIGNKNENLKGMIIDFFMSPRGDEK